MAVYVVRAFIQLRRATLASKQIGARLDELERKVGTHDRAVAHILEALRRLTDPPEAPRRRGIGLVQGG